MPKCGTVCAALHTLDTHIGRYSHIPHGLSVVQLFINPCTSDVVATTTAEALASGKWVLVEDLPCNTFFAQFPNCLMYTDAAEFSEKLEQALATEPARMDDETLGWVRWLGINVCCMYACTRTCQQSLGRCCYIRCAISTGFCSPVCQACWAGM